MPITNGKFTTKQRAIGLTVISLLCAAGVLCFYKHKQSNNARTRDAPIKKAVEYVFVSESGTAVILSEQDVFSIKQMYEDDVLPTEIAKQYGLNPVTICRIINSLLNIIN